MAPSEQMTASALEELLKNAALAGEWTLDPSRSAVSLTTRSMRGLVRVNGVFRQVTGNGTVFPAGQVSGVVTVAAASIDTKNTRHSQLPFSRPSASHVKQSRRPSWRRAGSAGRSPG
jgi:polyisoprenoid-binding protein YceI